MGHSSSGSPQVVLVDSQKKREERLRRTILGLERDVGPQNEVRLETEVAALRDRLKCSQEIIAEQGGVCRRWN